MKKKLISIITIFLFFIIRINPIYANMDVNNFVDGGMNFSMDMIMQQGMISMEGSNDIIEQAEETNFMNHDLDNTLTFFFDNLDEYQNFNDFFGQDNLIQDAFLNGDWSNSFNEHFNMDSGLLFPEITFMDDINVDSPQDLLDNIDITFNSYMPEYIDNENNNLIQEGELPNHSDIIDQINNNTMSDEMPEIPTSELPEVDNNTPSFNKSLTEENYQNKEENYIPENSNEISIPAE